MNSFFGELLSLSFGAPFATKSGKHAVSASALIAVSASSSISVHSAVSSVLESESFAALTRSGFVGRRGFLFLIRIGWLCEFGRFRGARSGDGRVHGDRAAPPCSSPSFCSPLFAPSAPTLSSPSSSVSSFSPRCWPPIPHWRLSAVSCSESESASIWCR